MKAKTKSGSQDGFKRTVLCTLWVSVGGDIRLNLLQNIVFISIVSLDREIKKYHPNTFLGRKKGPFFWVSTNIRK